MNGSARKYRPVRWSLVEECQFMEWYAAKQKQDAWRAEYKLPSWSVRLTAYRYGSYRTRSYGYYVRLYCDHNHPGYVSPPVAVRPHVDV